MSFVFNEHGCQVVKDFYSKEIDKLNKEIEFLENEKNLSTEPIVQKAFTDYIKKIELDISYLDIRIKALDSLINKTP